MAFREAATKKIGGKFLVFGETGGGKSWFTLTFPRLASVDSETGLAHYEGKPININGNEYNNLVFVDNTADLEELEEDLDALIDGEYDGKIDSFAVDSETKFYNTMQVGAMEVEERRAAKKGEDVDDATVSQRQWGRIKLINMKMQQAKIDLSTRGIHIISVAQGADLRDKSGKNIIGEKPDMHKSVPFDYDTVLRFYKEKDKKTGDIKYFAEVKKDRTNVTKEGDIIEDCTFDVWKEYYENMNSLDKNETNFSNDLQTSTDKMMSDADRSEKLAKKFRKLAKGLRKDDEKKTEMNNKVKELKINVKNLEINDVDKLEELVEFVEALKLK